MDITWNELWETAGLKPLDIPTCEIKLETEIPKTPVQIDTFISKCQPTTVKHAIYDELCLSNIPNRIPIVRPIYDRNGESIGFEFCGSCDRVEKNMCNLYARYVRRCDVDSLSGPEIAIEDLKRLYAKNFRMVLNKYFINEKSSPNQFYYIGEPLYTQLEPLRVGMERIKRVQTKTRIFKPYQVENKNRIHRQHRTSLRCPEEEGSLD
jgi:hypothetical protein